MLFNAAAITKIDSESVEKVSIPQKYQNLINKYPGLLKTEFKAKSNGNPVIHYIHTTGKPCKARLRPLMKGSPKEIKGKEAWQELIDYGIVEPVDVSKPTLWQSALHLQPKKSLYDDKNLLKGDNTN